MRPNFNVLVKSSRGSADGEIELHITRNGYQWQVVSLATDEAAKVAETIKDYLGSHPR